VRPFGPGPAHTWGYTQSVNNTSTSAATQAQALHRCTYRSAAAHAGCCPRETRDRRFSIHPRAEEAHTCRGFNNVFV